MRTISAAAIICALLAGSAPAARADIYKYIDERGVIHFTDRPTSDRYKPVFPKTNYAETERRYDHIIDMLCREHQLDVTLVKAVIKAESAFNPKAISRKGAQGLMQLMPDTARELRVDDPFDPYDNLQGGVRYLRRMLDAFGGNVTLALAAYNAGPNAVQSANAVPPFPETRTYIRRVLQYQREYLNVR